jgi:hypothetical protein
MPERCRFDTRALGENGEGMLSTIFHDMLGSSWPFYVARH